MGGINVNKMKKVSVVTLVLAMALFFTGCTNGELKLYNAFLKSQDIRSMESRTDLSFGLEGEGLSEENQAMLAKVSKMLNNYKITMNQKIEQNEDRTVVKAQVDSVIDMGGMKADLSVWIDADMSKDIPEMEQIIRMPKMLMAMTGEKFADKEYIVYDYNEILDMAESGIDHTKLMNWSKEAQPKITDFLKDYAKNFNAGIKMIESKGKKVVDKETLDIYELKLNDESFKNLVRYTGNNFMENEDMMKFMKEYVNMVISITESQNEEAKEVGKEIEKLEKELPNIKENFNKFMDEFDKIKVLGEEGIVIEYAVNKEGYIVSEKGSINLSIDLATIGNKINELDKKEVKALEMKGVIKLKIDFDTKNSNINKGVKIEMPKLTEENSLKFSDIIKSEL